MFTIRPPRSRIWGTTARVTAATPKKFVSNNARAVSMDVSSIAPLSPYPALFTSASILPCSPTIVSMQRSMDMGLVTSRAKSRIPAPSSVGRELTEPGFLLVP